MSFYKKLLFIFFLSVSSVWAITVKINDNYIYTIDADTKNLSLVSLRLYGSQNKWKEIAKWNNLSDPNYILLGQKLIIKHKPKISSEEGDLLLYKYYRRKFKIFTANSNSKREIANINIQEHVRKKNKKQSQKRNAEISFVSRLLVSAAYSSSILYSDDPENHLGSYGIGGMVGFNLKDILTIGISSEFRFINQYSSVNKIGSNMKGTFWNYASLSLGKKIKMIDLNLDLHYFGKYELSKKSVLGYDISYQNPLGYKLSAFYPLPILDRKLKIGFGFEWITLKKILLDDEEFNSNRKLWQTGIIFNYEF